MRNPRSGQSLLDVLIASALGALLLVGTLSILTPSLRGSSSAEHVQNGATLSRALLDGVRSFAASNWPVVAALTPGNSYYLGYNTNSTDVVSGIETVVMAPAGNLVGNWRLDEDPTADDAANAVHGASPATAHDGSLSPACQIDGCWNLADGGYAEVDDESAYQLSVGTLSAWVKTSVTSGSPRGIISKGDGYAMGLNAANELSFYDPASATWISTGVVISDGQWHHVACSFQDGVSKGTRCYVDGLLRTSIGITYSSTDLGQPLFIGSFDGGDSFLGEIDDARIYDAVLDANVIAGLAHAGASYRRWFTVASVQRNSSGAVVTSGGYTDPSTLQVTVSYVAPKTATRTVSTFITRSRSVASVQSDWSEGPTQTTATTSWLSAFASSTGISYASTTGSISITFP